MTIPVIHSLAVQYPQHEITVLSRAVWQPLFQGLPANVGFVGADLTGKHKGFWGLNSLYSELKAMHFDYIADFHHVLRSKYLCLRFRLANKTVASICIGRPAAHPCIRGNPRSSARLPCCLPRQISRRTGAGRTPMHTASATKAKTRTGAGPSRRIRGRTVEFGVETKNQSRSITCCIVRNTPSRRGRVRRLNATRLRNASGARRWSSLTPP